MWLLVRETEPVRHHGAVQEGRVSYYLLPGRQYSVGSNDCDLTLQPDPSVSPQHAVLRVERKKQSTDYAHESRCSVQVVDNSLSGSFVNRNKLLRSKKTLEDEDEIIFGSQCGVERYHLRWESPVICFSHFREPLIKLKQSLVDVGVSVLEEWEGRATHLVISEGKITKKLLLALSKRVPIVLKSWAEKLVDAINEFTPIPSPNNHLPELTEECKIDDVSLLLPDERRAKLFEKKHFYFLNKMDYQLFLLPVSQCSGSYTLVDMSDVTFATFDRYTTPDSVVICGNSRAFSSSSGATEFITNLQDRLKQAGRSMVSESLIIHAIIKISNKDLFGDDLCMPDSCPPGPVLNSQLFSGVARRAPPENPSPPIPVRVKTEPDTMNNMFSLFDEGIGDIDQFEHTATSTQRNSAIQMPAFDKQESTQVIRNDFSDWEIELGGRQVPSVRTNGTPPSSQVDPILEPMSTSPIRSPSGSTGWIRWQKNKDSPCISRNLSPPAGTEDIIIRKKCFVKNYWPGMDKKSYLGEPHPYRVITSVDPVYSSPEEADVPNWSVAVERSVTVQNRKRTPKKLQQSRLRSQIESPAASPRYKRVSILESPRSGKRSLLSTSRQIESDSDNEDYYLRVFP